jgi:hypothetical protein
LAESIDLDQFIDPDRTAAEIAKKYQSWENLRNSWLDEKQEIQEYIFATDTQTTTNASLPWKNKVHIPKLCQIRDNLHANYMATLFPNDQAIVWEGDDSDSETREKRKTIESYMQNKMKQSNFRSEVSRLVLDFIDYGNVFAMPVFEASYKEDPQTGEKIPTYIGPKLKRVAPENIVFDPTAPTFAEAPKIVRELRTLGGLKKDIATKPELAYEAEVFKKMTDLRGRFAPHTAGDFAINSTYQYAGFTGTWEYFNSGYVEILNFYGDFFDPETETLYENYLISVVDRAFIIRKQPLSNWIGSPPIRHAGWRVRQNNLYAMGPLDNLVGLQYRIDHLENAKADAFDLIVHPVMKITGSVEDFEYGPGERIYVSGDDGDVAFMQPDTTFLQADTQIAMYENKMEEMAGAPKQAVGFRTPGEKTAYEVQTLENGANRVFVNKISYFEEMFIEPLLNDMLEIARRNLNEADNIRVLDDETQAVTFNSITREDITARGKIRPIGARHFAQNATIIQNMTQFANSRLAQDPLVMNHISGRRLAIAVESLLGLDKYKLFQDNIRLYEQAEAQNLGSHLAQAVMEQQTATMSPEQAAQVSAAQAQSGNPAGNPNPGGVPTPSAPPSAQ